MTITVDEIWEVVKKAVKIMQNNSKNVVLYNDSEKIFRENFEYYHNFIENNFMLKEKSGKKHCLDRHKIAAIIICSVLKTKVVGVSKKYSEEFKDKEFLGNEKIAFEAALSYMYTELKRCFQKGEVPYKNIFDKYILPSPYSCERGYGEVICRDLYLSNCFFDLNPLLLANLMFYIEEYSFAISRIERK